MRPTSERGFGEEEEEEGRRHRQEAKAKNRSIDRSISSQSKPTPPGSESIESSTVYTGEAAKGHLDLDHVTLGRRGGTCVIKMVSWEEEEASTVNIEGGIHCSPPQIRFAPHPCTPLTHLYPTHYSFIPRRWTLWTSRTRCCARPRARRWCVCARSCLCVHAFTQSSLCLSVCPLSQTEDRSQHTCNIRHVKPTGHHPPPPHQLMGKFLAFIAYSTPFSKTTASGPAAAPLHVHLCQELQVRFFVLRVKVSNDARGAFDPTNPCPIHCLDAFTQE
jgi:hypothetical protein